MQKYAHLNRDVKNGAIHIQIKKNGSVIYSFLGKRGLIVYLAALKKGAIRATHPYHVIYREFTNFTNLKVCRNLIPTLMWIRDIMHIVI